MSILGSGFRIALPDEEWTRFLELMWRPFLVDPGKGARVVEVRPHPAWGWELRAGEEPLGMSRDRWFLAAELRYWVVRHAVEDAPGFLLHAAVVARDARALLLLAESGGGKTTLSLALRDQGWSYYGDDLALLDPDTLTIRALPTPIGIRERARWPELALLWDGRAPWDPSGHFLVPAAPLVAGPSPPLSPVALAFLAFEPDGGAAAEPLTTAAATVLSARQSTRRDREAIAALSRLCRSAACARLTYGSSAEATSLIDDLWPAA